METMLTRDKRIRRTIDDFYMLNKTLSSGLGRLSEKSRIKLTYKDIDTGGYRVCCRIRNKKLHEIMNSIVDVADFSWNKIDKGYELDDSLSVYDQALKPRNEFHKLRNEAVIPILDMLDRLSSKELEEISSHPGVLAKICCR
jgi:hypothetical protein